MNMIVLSRPNGKNKALFEHLTAKDLEVFEEPFIKYSNLSLEKEDFEFLKASNWFIFFSSQGVSALSEIIREKSVPKTVKIAVIGKKTEKMVLKLLNRSSDFVSIKSSALEFFKQFQNYCKLEESLALIQGNISSNLFEELCIKNNINHRVFTIYETKSVESISPAFQELLKTKRKFVFPFFSPSAFYSALKIIPNAKDIFESSSIVSIGDTTTRAIEDAGFRVARTSKIPSWEGVYQELLKLY